MSVEKLDVNRIVQEVMQRLAEKDIVVKPSQAQITPGANGVYTRIEDAIQAAGAAQKRLLGLCMERRRDIIEAMRQAVINDVEQIAKIAVEETGMGRIKHKVAKNILAAKKTPGIEALSPTAYTGDHGFTLEEQAPFGVIGAITPSTNPSETVISNAIGMIAAGNSVVFNAHPAAKKVTAHTIKLLNKAIVEAGGPENLLSGVAEPTKESGLTLMTHPTIRLLVVTGGPEIVALAMKSGKRTIGAGPGNPPVVVDSTANIPRAAKDIVAGASFDNNVLCIAEKEVFVVSDVADQLVNQMVKSGSYKLNASQLESLMKEIATKDKVGDWVANRKYIGKNVQFILESIGIQVGEEIRLAIAEVSSDHPLVQMEQLMPVMPIVRVNSVEQAIDQAYQAEHNYFHTAMMHSTNVDNLSKMAAKMNTTIFVKNGPSYSGLGMYGEGYASYTLASSTGDGVTCAASFTRKRRCVLKDGFRII